MKQLLSIIFILTFSLSVFSQKSKTQKHKKTVKTAKAIEEEAVMDALDNHEYVMEGSRVVDTLHINEGKPCLIIADIPKYSNGSSTIYPDNSEKEEEEIIRNFGKDALRIVKVHQHSYIVFENKQTLDVSDFDGSYQAFGFWGGKLEDRVKAREGTHYATEFVAEEMGLNKESSYVVSTRKYKKEVASLEKADKVTEKSKKTMNAFLNSLTIPLPQDKGEDTPLYSQSSSNLKSIETYFLEKNGKKILLKSMAFNKEQQPILIKHYNSEGKENGTNSFVYKNEMLVEILNGDSHTTVKYDDDKMIFFDSAGDADETRVTWLKNDILLEKDYVLLIDDKHQYMNTYVEEKIENNCIARYINNTVWSINCSSNTETSPFVHQYTSFQDGEVLQYRKSKLVKTGEKQFEKYYSDAERENEKDNFLLWGTFQLNDQNLLSLYSFTKNGVKRSIKVEYTYFPEPSR